MRFKLLKYKENNNEICDTCGHNFRYGCTFMYNELGIILERHYFVLYDSTLALKKKKSK